MFDQATAAARLNITDPSMVAMAGTTIDTALAIAETLCDRKFILADDEETFVHPFAHALLLRRYPIDEVTSISGLAHSESYHADKPGGLIIIDGRATDHVVTVTYKGGYAVLPADLELALWLIFDTIWPSVSGQGGAAAGGGAIKAIRSNGASVEYDTSSSAGGGLTSAGAGGLPGGALSILEKYRRHTC